MILLWGVPGDAPLDAVTAALEARDADFGLLDQRRAAETRVSLTVEMGGALSGTISGPCGDIDVRDVGSVYIRPLETSKAIGTENADDPRLVRGVATDGALVAWADLTQAAVINRPAAMAANNSKPYQLGLIRGYGLAVPDTLVTTDAEAARSFRTRHGDVIYKSVSGVRSIVSRVGEIDEDTFRNVANCPTQFQEYIGGSDIRVHVVGEATFGSEIRSAADDYRYAARVNAGVEMAPIELPESLASACCAMARGMGLYFAGIDFRRTPEGVWYCLEVNPSPGFTYYESATGQPIADAVADLLLDLTRSSN